MKCKIPRCHQPKKCRVRQDIWGRRSIGSIWLMARKLESNEWHVGDTAEYSLHTNIAEQCPYPNQQAVEDGGQDSAKKSVDWLGARPQAQRRSGAVAAHHQHLPAFRVFTATNRMETTFTLKRLVWSQRHRPGRLTGNGRVCVRTISFIGALVQSP